MSDYPTYDQLPAMPQTGDRHAWGVFGKDDRIGAINRLTPDRVRRAAGLVRRGQMFNLSLPLNVPSPTMSQVRKNYRHEVYSSRRNQLDDKVDDFYLQASSQIDALSHIRYREHGFYNGVQDEEVEAEGLGVHQWAEHGIVGRGVLLDMPRHLERTGVPFDPSKDIPFDVPLVEAALDAQGVRTEPGDILLLRTGWIGWFLGLPDEAQKALPRHPGDGGYECPGLVATKEMAAFLWDRGFSLVAADNVAVEDAPGSPDAGFLLRRVIPLLGLTFGELRNFEALAEDCAADGVYECMLVSVPLNLPGGIGSPANAIAIK